MAKEVTEAVQHKAPVSGDVEAAEGQRAESEDYSGGEGDEEVARTSAEAATLLAGEGGPVASVGPTVGQVLRGLVLTVYLPSLLFGLADGIALPMVPIFARKLQCGETKIGACTAANPAGKFLGDVPAGALAARVGLKWAMVIGLLGYGLASAVASLANGFWWLFICLLFAGGSSACFTVSRSATMRTEVATEHRGRAVSLLGGVNRLTRAIGPVVGGLLSHNFGVQSALIARGILAVSASIIVAATMPASTHGLQKKGHGEHNFFQAVRSYWRIYATAGAAAFCLSYLRRIRVFIVPLQGDDLHLSHHQIGLAVTAGFVIDSMLFAPVGWAMDNYGRKWTGVPALAILSAGISSIAGASNMTILMIASVVMGIGNGLSAGFNMTLGGDLAPPAPLAAQFLGVWSLICDAGAMIGPVIAGGIAEHAGMSTAALMNGALGFVGTFWFIVSVKETLRKRAPTATGRAMA